MNTSNVKCFVERLVFDEWDHVHCNEVEVRAPAVDDVLVAINALDAKRRTLVVVHGIDGASVTVGGGCGQYVLCAATSSGELWNLISDIDSRSSPAVLLNAGGQEGDFPARQVVSLPLAARAAKTFAQEGQLDSSLRWELQS